MEARAVRLFDELDDDALFVTFSAVYLIARSCLPAPLRWTIHWARRLSWRPHRRLGDMPSLRFDRWRPVPSQLR
jgi:hypothetical protein